MRKWFEFLSGPLETAGWIVNPVSPKQKLHKILDAGFCLKGLESAIQVNTETRYALGFDAAVLVQELDTETTKMTQIVRKALAAFDSPALLSVNIEKLGIQSRLVDVKISRLRNCLQVSMTSAVYSYVDLIDHEYRGVKRIIESIAQA